MEHKSVSIELKDFSAKSRTAIVAHAVYDNIDRVGDISRKGMFTKSWKESPLVDFWFNHGPKQVPGTVTRTFEDETKAYSELKFGNWTLGNDVLEMADAGVDVTEMHWFDSTGMFQAQTEQPQDPLHFMRPPFQKCCVVLS